MANKMTKKEILVELANLETIKTNKTYADFIAHEIELLEKKSKATNKATAEKQARYETIKARMLDEMEVGKKYRVTELMKELPVLLENDDLNTSSVTYLVTSLTKEFKLVKSVEKGASYYSLA